MLKKLYLTLTQGGILLH